MWETMAADASSIVIVGALPDQNTVSMFHCAPLARKVPSVTVDPAASAPQHQPPLSPKVVPVSVTVLPSATLAALAAPEIRASAAAARSLRCMESLRNCWWANYLDARQGAHDARTPRKGLHPAPEGRVS